MLKTDKTAVLLGVYATVEQYRVISIKFIVSETETSSESAMKFPGCNYVLLAIFVAQFLPATASGQSNREEDQKAFVDRVVSKLQTVRKFPKPALSRGEQGLVVVQFSIDGNGNLISSSIYRSSCFLELDEEALKIVSKAQPFPQIPASFNRAILHMRVPIRFNLSGTAKPPTLREESYFKECLTS